MTNCCEHLPSAAAPPGSRVSSRVSDDFAAQQYIRAVFCLGFQRPRQRRGSCAIRLGKAFLLSRPPCLCMLTFRTLESLPSSSCPDLERRCCAASSPFLSPRLRRPIFVSCGLLLERRGPCVVPSPTILYSALYATFTATRPNSGTVIVTLFGAPVLLLFSSRCAVRAHSGDEVR